MKKLSILLLTICCCLTTTVCQAKADKNFWVFLCFGQSNMEGAAKPEDVDMVGVSDRFMSLTPCETTPEQAQWHKALPPLCRKFNGMTPVDYFGRTLIDNLPDNIKIGVINVSIGGCKIEAFMQEHVAHEVSVAPPAWQRAMFKAYNDDPYDYLVRLAKRAQQDGVIKGILLHQGESNTGQKDWPDKVNTVYERLLKDLGLKAKNVPLLAGEVVIANGKGQCVAMNPIIDELPKTIKTAHVIKADGLTNGPDNLHFDAMGYRQFGQRYAAAMLPLLGVKNPKIADLTKQIPAMNKARFTDFVYEGQDPIADTNIQVVNGKLTVGTYPNPILPGCAPDPSITRKGNDYYLANSSFSYWPGVPVWHSTNLIEWDFAGYALNRPSQMFYDDGNPLSQGVYAPDIQYNPYNDTFYLIVNTFGSKVQPGGVVIVKSKDPKRGWSDPIKLNVPGIDPSFYFTEDGKAYIVNNQEPPGPAEYDGHRAIYIREYDINTDQIVGNATLLVDKGVVPADKPIWIEGPHLYKVNGRYYLMCAEGGTGDWHSEVVFVSDQVDGPYEPCLKNPILTQRTLSKDRQNPVTATGHADLVQTPDGNWYAVFLSILPFEYTDKSVICNTGRSTMLLPVTWENDQPMIWPADKEIPMVNKPIKIFDNFQKLDPMWITVRTPKTPWYRIAQGHDIVANSMEIQARPVSINETKNPSFLGRWLKNMKFNSGVTVDFTPNTADELAGLCLYQREGFNYVIGKTLSADGKPIVVLYKGKDVVATVPAPDGPLTFSVKADKADYQFFCNGQAVGTVQDGRFLSTEKAGGFTGATIGMYATCKK